MNPFLQTVDKLGIAYHHQLYLKLLKIVDSSN